MPPRKVLFLPDNYYHVYNRGNSRRKIFFVKNDYFRFMAKLISYSREYKVTVLAYCLMPNHFHLLVRQNSVSPISEMMRKLSVAYSMYFNLKFEDVGPVFQGRFKAKAIMDDAYLLHLSRYIHRNPEEITRDIRRYPWSSYKYYLGLEKNTWVETTQILNYFLGTRKREMRMKKYRDFVEEKITDEEKKELGSI